MGAWTCSAMLKEKDVNGFDFVCRTDVDILFTNSWRKLVPLFLFSLAEFVQIF